MHAYTVASYSPAPRGHCKLTRILKVNKNIKLYNSYQITEQKLNIIHVFYDCPWVNLAVMFGILLIFHHESLQTAIVFKLGKAKLVLEQPTDTVVGVAALDHRVIRLTRPRTASLATASIEASARNFGPRSGLAVC